MTSSNGNIFRVTGHLCGEFTGPRWIPRTKASDAKLWCFFYLRLNQRLSKQSWGWRFETLTRSLWHHCNDTKLLVVSKCMCCSNDATQHHWSCLYRLVVKMSAHIYLIQGNITTRLFIWAPPRSYGNPFQWEMPATSLSSPIGYWCFSLWKPWWINVHNFNAW